MMEQISRRGFGVMAVAAGLLPLRTAQAKSADGTLTVGIPVDFITLDPSQDISLNGMSLFSNIYERLVEIDGEGTVTPWLAASWKASADASTWDVTLRPEPRFHDNTPVTAEDVAWTYTTSMNDPKSSVRAYMSMIKSVEAVDPGTVRFTLNKPFAPFDRQMSLISILPKAAYERLGAAGFAQAPIGSGAFKVAKWVRDDHMQLEAVPTYWRGAPGVRRVVIRPIPAETSRTAALSSGDVDLVAMLAPAVVERLSTAAAVNVAKVQSNRVVYLGFNTSVPPLDNLKVRQAIDLCIDRNTIATRLLRGLATPHGQLVGPPVFGYDKAIGATAFDLARARALVQESGYKNQPIVLQYPIGYFNFGNEMAQVLANAMKAAGLNVELQGLDIPAFYPLWLGNKLGGTFFFAMAPTTWDADVAITNLLGTGSKGYWTSPELDQLIAAQRVEADPAKRRALISDIWKLNRDNVGYSVLYLEHHAYGLTKGLDFQPRADTLLVYRKSRWG